MVPIVPPSTRRNRAGRNEVARGGQGGQGVSRPPRKVLGERLDAVPRGALAEELDKDWQVHRLFEGFVQCLTQGRRSGHAPRLLGRIAQGYLEPGAAPEGCGGLCARCGGV